MLDVIPSIFYKKREYKVIARIQAKQHRSHSPWVLKCFEAPQTLTHSGPSILRNLSS